MLIFQIFQGADLIICNFIKWKKYENLQLVEERNDKEYCPNRSLLNLNLVDIQKYALETLKQQNRNILFNFCWGCILFRILFGCAVFFVQLWPFLCVTVSLLSGALRLRGIGFAVVCPSSSKTLST